MALSMLRLTVCLGVLCAISTTTSSSNLMQFRARPSRPLARNPPPQCILGHISEEDIVPRAGFSVDHMELLGKANDAISVSDYILRCCELGPSRCQYMWIVDNVCYAVSCDPGHSDACLPLPVHSVNDFMSIYFKMTVSYVATGGHGRENELEAELPDHMPDHVTEGERKGGKWEEALPDHVTEEGRGGKWEELPDQVTEGEGKGEEKEEEPTTPEIDLYPQADAGPDITIMYPSTTKVLLNGSNSADDKGISYYLWQLTSQDHLDQATLIDPTLPELHVLNLTPGVYTFSLTVADTALQLSTDGVTVTVVREKTEEVTPPTLPPTEDQEPQHLNTASTEDQEPQDSSSEEMEGSATNSSDTAAIAEDEADVEGYTRRSNLLKVAVPVLVVLAVILMTSALIVTCSFFVCERNRRHMKHLYRYKRLPETIQKT